jgi:nucleotide-binding universal stress UspA family protein
VSIGIGRILCPVDFSDFSRRALDHAIAVAKWYGSRLSVLYVYHLPIPVLVPLTGLATTQIAASGVLSPGDHEELRQQLKAFVPAQAVGNIPVDVCVAEGDVAVEILAEAASADMVVMGTHGRSGFEHLVLGSVAEKVLRKATCPLLTIPRAASDAAGEIPRLFHRIVAAVDFSDVSMRAMDYALSLAKEADAHLTVVHVIHVPEHIALWFEHGDAVSPVREMQAAAERRLRSAVADEVRAYCHVSERVEVGDPYREILRVADEEHAGLIVLGAHGQTVIERMFVGSTAQHVVRHAACPVLTVRNTRTKSKAA